MKNRIAGFGAGLALASFLIPLSVAAQESGETIRAHGYSNFSELKYGADFPHLDYVNPEAPKGGEISVSTIGTFDTMNPYVAKGSSGLYASIGYERLMTATADEVGTQYCLLCKEIEYPEDESWVIFHLHDDITFSDGTPATAHDVVFTHNLFMEQGLISYREAVAQIIEKAEALDDHTVKFTFLPDSPVSGRIEQAGATPVQSKAWYEETGARLDESRFDISPGTGPYALDRYDVNETIIYKKNPEYWGDDLPINVGRNNFDAIRVEYFADSNAAFEGFKAGEFTFRRENSSINWATAYDFPSLEKGWVVKETIEDGSLPPATGFIFNLRRPQFEDVRVREAIGLMYNFTWTNENLQYGLFQQRESFWQGSKLAAEGVPEGQELANLESVADMIAPEILTEPVTMPHESGERQLDRKNLRAASALLDEAGWAVGDDGMRRKDGQTLDLEILGYSPNFDRIMNPYVDNLKRLGVNASYNRIDPAQYTERYYAFEFDMVYGGYSVGLEEGNGLGQRFGSDGVGDVFNPAGYSSEAVDALIEIVEDAETYDDMAAGVRAIDRIMRREHFVIPAHYLGKYWVAYFNMYEHPEEIPPYDLGELDFWWYNAEKADELRAEGAFR